MLPLCGSLFYDFRDGQSYNTVEIGGRCWKVENLNIGQFTTSFQNDDGINHKICMTGIPNYCDDYGGLYQWYEVMDYTTEEGAQGNCSDGWYIPSDFEWL